MSKAAKQEKSPEVQKLEADVQAIREVKAAVRPINAQRVMRAQSAYMQHSAITPLEDTIEQIVDPKYWIHIQHQLKPLDEIRVVPDDRRFVAKLLVLAVQLNHVPVALVEYKDLPHVDMLNIPSKYRIAYAGPYEMFRVMEGDRVLMSNIQTADQAKVWLRDHIKALNL